MLQRLTLTYFSYEVIIAIKMSIEQDCSSQLKLLQLQQTKAAGLTYEETIFLKLSMSLPEQRMRH